VRLVQVLKAVGIAPSTWYRESTSDRPPAKRGPDPKPIPEEIEELIVANAMRYPWWGYRKIAIVCRRTDKKVKDKQAYRVMKKHKLLRVLPERVAELYQAAKLYELLPTKPNSLWQVDVTYIHIPTDGWWYAVTVIDYYSRYLLAIHFTSSYSAGEAIIALEEAKKEAERIHGPLKEPPFVVTDNGPSFIARKFTQYLEGDFQHVRIRYRTPQQLGLLERFHRTLKDEEVYWRIYDSPWHARECLVEFRSRYNGVRPHWALAPEGGGDPLTPEDVYVRGGTITIPRWQGWAKGAKERLDKLLERDATMKKAVGL
jgi:transposase InsO family protein